MSQSEVKYWELVAKKSDGTISEAEAAELEALEKSIPYLAEAAKSLSEIKVGFGIGEEEEKRARLETWAKIENGMKSGGKSTPLSRRIMKYAAAAVILLAVGVGTLSLALFGGRREMLSAVNDSGNVEVVVMEDSTRVWLHQGAKITYPAKFSRRMRPVELSGEAFFDVASDSRRPFIVATKNIDIKVLGTKFNVRESDLSTEVMLESGSVALTASGGDEGVIMRPGELAVVNNKNSEIVVSQDDAAIHSIWKENELVFRSQKLGVIFRYLERAFDANIQTDNNILANTVYTGRFKKSAGLDEILSIIQMNTGMKYRTDENGIVRIE